jgi:hypothetical protein
MKSRINNKNKGVREDGDGKSMVVVEIYNC